MHGGLRRWEGFLLLLQANERIEDVEQQSPSSGGGARRARLIGFLIAHQAKCCSRGKSRTKNLEAPNFVCIKLIFRYLSRFAVVKGGHQFSSNDCDRSWMHVPVFRPPRSRSVVGQSNQLCILFHPHTMHADERGRPNILLIGVAVKCGEERRQRRGKSGLPSVAEPSKPATSRIWKDAKAGYMPRPNAWTVDLLSTCADKTL